MNDSKQTPGVFIKWSLLVVIAMISMVSTFGYYIDTFPDLIPPIFGSQISQILGGLWGVTILDLSALGWLYIHLKLANSEPQQWTSLSLSILDMLGSAVTSLVYLLLKSSMTDLPESMGILSVWVLAIITIVNFIGVWYFSWKDANSIIADSITTARAKMMTRTAILIQQKAARGADQISDIVSSEITEQVLQTFLRESPKPHVDPKPEVESPVTVLPTPTRLKRTPETESSPNGTPPKD